MATKVEQELERAKHDQDLPEVQRAADAARRQERKRTEHENQVNRAHEALIEESQRAHFFSSEN